VRTSGSRNECCLEPIYPLQQFIPFQYLYIYFAVKREEKTAIISFSKYKSSSYR